MREYEVVYIIKPNFEEEKYYCPYLIQWEVRQQILWQACCLWFSRLVPRHSRAAPDLSILVKPLEGEGLPEK